MKTVGGTVEFTSLSELQAAKWFLLHERNRHVEDILKIDQDLQKLTDIELPKDVMSVLDARFEV